ncbi:MAG: cytochrome b/b6 domain-containing protein [Proteobacteria bacterium]|nr:cytochrome b/b6 domain-containing protein [Pseudomonadota bacterium]
MSFASHAAQPGSTSLPASAPQTVRVWDPVVRIFHWGVAIAFLIACLTAEELDGIHRATGYLIAALLAVRVVWGLIGTKYARFIDFVRSPRTALEYLRQSRDGTAPRYLGHNPAGGLMAIALMGLLGGICYTGYLMTTPQWWGSELMEGLHETLVNGTIGLIVLHILGNVFSSIVHRENLTLSMITGRKRVQ